MIRDNDMVTILQGDCVDVMKGMDEKSVNCCVTSPPYWGLRDYGCEGQIGLESTPEAYVENMVAVFREVRRVLKDDGTVWLNLGDSYCGGGTGGHIDHKASVKEKANAVNKAVGLKPKDLVGIPWRVAFALQADGWYLRQDIIWSKPNPMPESVTDRCTKAHEYIFLLSKSAKYWYDADAIKEPAAEPDRVRGDSIGDTQRKLVDRPVDRVAEQSLTRNKRSVWTVTTKPYKHAHFATFPPALIRPCVLAGCPQKGTVLDPFGGSGTTGAVAEEEGRNSVLIELNPEYIELANKRTSQMGLFT